MPCRSKSRPWHVRARQTRDCARCGSGVQKRRKNKLPLDDIKHLAHQGSDKYQIYEELAVDDIKRAADVLRSVYVQSDETDGFVSLEVPPELCHDYEQTVAEARRLWAKIERPNLIYV